MTNPIVSENNPRSQQCTYGFDKLHLPGFNNVMVHGGSQWQWQWYEGGPDLIEQAGGVYPPGAVYSACIKNRAPLKKRIIHNVNMYISG